MNNLRASLELWEERADHLAHQMMSSGQGPSVTLIMRGTELHRLQAGRSV